MLFHTWTFLIFMAVVLSGLFALRSTRLWIPWLLLASYSFYGWWNPYYLILVFYSTVLDFVLVALMDHCPSGREQFDWRRRLGRLHFSDRVMQWAFVVTATSTIVALVLVFAGPKTLRPTMALLSLLLGLMALGAFFGSRHTWLVVSIVNNFAILAFFKYAGFFTDNINALLGWCHSSMRLPNPSSLMPFGAPYLLPAGISFFTFQSLSYTIDFYRKLIPRERNFLRFATFVAFFPQLMAGPIERASHLLPQFYRFPKVRLQNLTDGLSLFLVGLFKKLALANYLSLYVERIYPDPKAFDGATLAAATFAFAWQIFFDFSGYTDMARGVARVMGFDLMLNFNNPYLATGLGDFWSRWHISLSTWFRDYVYIPLGGNRRGVFITYRNLFLTFFISGIWHGAAWTFVVWGLLHAAGILITRELERSAFYRQRVPRLAKQLATFGFVCFAWIFFRAASLSDAVFIVTRIFHDAWTSPQIPVFMLFLIGLIWLYQFAYESRFKPILESAWMRVAGAALIILYLCMFATEGGTFIYFQF
jgi:D-alanyl-lipoteichoic acid acyltransferase DltB (MBOAT superfamily)